MKEEDKLQEAMYFYKKMEESVDFPLIFGYNLSAFLSASRSVLQYLLEDVKPQRGGQAWYDNLIANSTYSKYFKDKRDINIHENRIETTKGVGIELQEEITISESVSIEIRDASGELKGSHNSKNEPKKNNKPKKPVIKIIYNFDDWSGSEDVLQLSKGYLNELNLFLQDGNKEGFLNYF